MSVIGRLLRRREPVPAAPQDPMRFYLRARVVKNRIDRLALEARLSDDPKRVEAIRDEMRVCLEGLYDIHEEQLAAELARVS